MKTPVNLRSKMPKPQNKIATTGALRSTCPAEGFSLSPGERDGVRVSVNSGQIPISATPISHSRAFTLLELLVVTATLAILAALLLPALAGTRSANHGIYCMNNTRQLMNAVHMYAADSNDWLPGNADDPSFNNWVKGDMGTPDATNTLFLTNAAYCKISPYTGPAPSLFRCPADRSSWDPVFGTITSGQRGIPRVRSYSMNQAVGTKPPGFDGTQPGQNIAVNGPWLNGQHTHIANHPYRTYGRLADVIAPSPANLFVFLDEAPLSINDGSFAMSMTGPNGWPYVGTTVLMIDWPATYHDFGGGFAFADGHSEIHKWTDARTLQPSPGGTVDQNNPVPNPDILWIQQHTSAPYH